MKWGLIASCLGVAIPALAVPAALVWSSPACADSWLPPSTETYLSPNGKCRLTIVPRDLENVLDYFEGKAAEIEPGGQRNAGVEAPNATLERRGADGIWTTIWKRALVNEVAPTSALISPDGRYVVTFDNWHSIGWGENAIVIYDVMHGGERRISVEKLLGADYFRTLSHSISSVMWRNEARFVGRQLVIDILVPDEDHAVARTVKLVIDPATGAAQESDTAAWRVAHAAAARINIAMRRDEAEARAARAAPLFGPKPNEGQNWGEYLRKAFFRLDPAWIEDDYNTNVLLQPNAGEYAASRRWISQALREGTHRYDAVLFAGMDEPALLEVLREELARIAPGKLGKARIYVAASAPSHTTLKAIFANAAGGQLVLLDPAKGIPQRPEGMPRADGSLPMPHDFRSEPDED